MDNEPPPPYTESVPPEATLPDDAAEERTGRAQQLKRTWLRLSTPSWLYPFYVRACEFGVFLFVYCLECMYWACSVLRDISSLTRVFASTINQLGHNIYIKQNLRRASCAVCLSSYVSSPSIMIVYASFPGIRNYMFLSYNLCTFYQAHILVIMHLVFQLGTNHDILTHIQGIGYFARNRFLWPLLKGRLIPCFILSLFIYTILFLVAYLPQVAFLAIWHGFNASAWINGASLVLGEGSLIIALLFEALLVDHTQVDIFDTVLVAEGLPSLAARGRVIHDDPNLGPRERLGKCNKEVERVYSPFSLRQVLEFVFFLPLNFIPYAGIPLFLLVTGMRAGPFQHWRYFKLLGLTKKERKVVERRMSATYTWFGTVHLALQLVPGFSMLFLLTTAAGSALWVVNLEKERQAAVQGRSAGSQPNEEYVDNPV